MRNKSIFSTSRIINIFILIMMSVLSVMVFFNTAAAADPTATLSPTVTCTATSSGTTPTATSTFTATPKVTPTVTPTFTISGTYTTTPSSTSSPTSTPTPYTPYTPDVTSSPTCTVTPYGTTPTATVIVPITSPTTTTTAVIMFPINDVKASNNILNPMKSSQPAFISFNQETTGRISVKIYTTRGKLVRTLVDNEEYQPGPHTMEWYGKVQSGEVVPSGIYVVHIQAPGISRYVRIAVIK